MGKLSNLTDLRLSRRMTQEDMAEYLHVSKEQYARYEKGTSSLKREILFGLADFFHVSIDYLLGYEPTEYPPELSHFLEQKSAAKDNADYDFQVRMPSGGEKLDGGLLEVMVDYERCDKTRRAQMVSVASCMALACRTEREQKKKRKRKTKAVEE